MLRARALGAMCSIVLCLFVASCGGDDDESSTAGPAPTGAGSTARPAPTGEFVGTASDDETYVGVFADASQVVAYVCNRRVGLEGAAEVADWFTGPASGSTIDLTSQSGKSHLRATLERTGATGSVQLPDGRSVTFKTVSAAPGPAGIFEVSLDAAGNLVGRSRGGKTFLLTPFEKEQVPGYTGNVTLPDGKTVPYELFVRGGRLTPQDIANMGTPRTIILEDGTSRGILDPIARKGKATTS